MSVAERTTSIDDVANLLDGKRVCVLTGAGCSTESGIPDYRGPDGSMRRRQPMQYIEFVRQAPARQRYWARSAIGWRTFAHARPNAAHHAIAQLQAHGQVTGLITQNVDGLHDAAKSPAHIELHGSLHRVTCLSCNTRRSRIAFQERLLALNPRSAFLHAEIAPDGDADLAPEHVQDFVVPPCDSCGGVLKPDVVFFGENVPPPLVSAAWQELERADVLLVVGSSLTVFSGYRFVVGASERKIPVVIVNRGTTRGDALATLRLDMPAGAALSSLAAVTGASAQRV